MPLRWLRQLRLSEVIRDRELLAALLLAGVRNIQPQPVGFKFHAVLVVNSAHLASLSSPDSDRWLPIFWALDYFKSAQAQDEREGDWTMAPVDESKVPPSHKAKAAFIEAMDNWDEASADAAITARLTVGIVLAIGGLTLAFAESASLGGSALTLAGAGAVALAPVGIAIGGVSIERRVETVDAFPLNGWAMLIGGLTRP